MDINNQNPEELANDGFDSSPNERLTRHPTERALQRYAANETGPQAKRIVTKHLEQCAECRSVVSKFRNLNRTFREFERVAIARAASERRFVTGA
jgi:anti-sigma factor RsiW